MRPKRHSVMKHLLTLMSFSLLSFLNLGHAAPSLHPGETQLSQRELAEFVDGQTITTSINGTRIGVLTHTLVGTQRTITLREIAPVGGAESTSTGVYDIDARGKYCMRLQGRGEAFCFHAIRSNGAVMLAVDGAPANKPRLFATRGEAATTLTATPPVLRAGESLVARQALVNLIRGSTVRYRNANNTRMTSMTLADATSEVIVTTTQVSGGGKPTRQTGTYSINPSGRYCHVLQGDPNNYCFHAVKSGGKHFLIWDDAGQHRLLLED